MAASDISRQIEEAEEEKRLYVKELTYLNEWIERLQQKRDGGKALTDDEKADMTKWEAKEIRVRQSSDLLTQPLRELAADAKELLHEQQLRARQEHGKITVT